MLSGKKQAQAEKNLQTLFKEFYAEASKVDIKDKVMNSAKSSLGGLSSTLEKRRERMRKMKEDAMNIDKEKDAAKAKDKATDKATKAEPGKADTAKDKETEKKPDVDTSKD